MIHVLVADDELIERRYLSALFARHSDRFQIVGEARNGREVVELAAKVKPDVIIMDINMPGIDGLHSARQIKKQFPDIIILLNTAYAEFEFARKALEYQLDAYLLKPASEETILATIQDCIRKRRLHIGIPSAHAAAVVENGVYAAKDPVMQVVAYIDVNSHCALSLEELAAVAHFTPTYLSRIFHERMGLTVTAYITKRRIENAKYLLVHSVLDSREIAQQCGFASVSHFNRVFKQQTGLAPLEFRHQRA